MNAAALVSRVQRLDRLYLAACDAQDQWIAEPSSVNYRRWVFYQLRYQRLVAEWSES